MRLFEAKDPFEMEWLLEREQERIALGSHAQDIVAADMKRKFPRSYTARVAARSSKKTDVEFALDDKHQIRVEVKFIKAMVTVYDMSVSRGYTDSFLDWIAKRIVINPKGLSFVQLIDQERKKDKTIGFAGDAGTAKSGRVPPWWLTSPQVLSKLRDKLIERYASKGDNYLAVVNEQGQVHYFHVSGPVIPQLGNAPFPQVLRAKTDTYGASPAGSLRVAVKVYLGL